MPDPRIAIVIGNPQALDVFFRQQTQFLQSEGFEMHAICSPGPELDQFHAATGAPVHAVRIRRAMRPFADLVTLVRIWRTLRRVAPDVVHAHMPKPGLLGMIAAFAARVPVRFFTYHGLRTETLTGWQLRVVSLTDRLTSRFATHVLAVSPSLRSTVIDHGLCPAGKIRVIGHGACAGVDTAVFDPDVGGLAARRAFHEQYAIPSGALVIGFAGRIARDKGIAELAAAWAQLRRKHSHLYLFLAGFEDPDDPVDAAVLQQLYADPRVRASRKLLRDMPAVYSALDILVLPSYREGFGVAAIEAAAMRVPVVASRVDGIVDAVQDGVTGILVPPRAAAQLAAALESLIANPARRYEMGAAARLFADDRFSAAAVSTGLLREYRDALSVRGAAPAISTGKRIFDLVVALPLLFLTAPVLLAAALAVRISLGSPVFFRQSRGGLHGRPFTLYKLRTMNDRRDAAGNLLPDQQRLTFLGRLLRKSSIDELPQLWNVLKGEMSLVGPRPLLTAYCRRYNSFEARRLEVLPGITGWAQVSGRNHLSWSEKFRLDVWYVDHRSFLFDLRILFMTVWRALRPSGVEAPGQQSVTEFTGTISEAHHG